MLRITPDDSTVEKLDNSSILVASLLSNGTVFISSTSLPRKYLSDLMKDFADLSPIFIQLESFRNNDDFVMSHGWRDPREKNTNTMKRRSLYQWRYKFSILGAKIVDRKGGSPYVVSTSSQQTESGASETIFPWLEREARNFALCPEITSWVERCHLSPPTWASWDNEAKRDQFLDLIGNKQNYADHTIQRMVELSFNESMTPLIQNLVADGYMAIKVSFADNDGDEKYFTVTKIKREGRWDANDRDQSLDDSVNESSGAFRWLNRDLKVIKKVGGKYYKFAPTEIDDFLRRIIVAAMYFAEDRLKDQPNEIAFSLLSDAIPKDNILFVFLRETDGVSKIEDAWLAL